VRYSENGVIIVGDKHEEVIEMSPNKNTFKEFLLGLN
jgi:hypothetical protein